MAEILDNQEVTTETLNNIAVDLGATSFNGFTENKFGADALNDITKALVGSGITQGGNKCKPYLSGSDLYINTGTIIFASGAKIRVTEPQKVTKQANTYIYALNDTALNTAQIVVSETEPTTGDFVKLAYVDENGALSDRRQWAESNVLLGQNQTLTVSIGGHVSGGNDNNVIIETETSWNGWTRFICEGYNDNVNRKIQYFASPVLGDDFVKLADEFDGNIYAYAKRDGSKLILRIGTGGSGKDYSKELILI